MLPITSLGGAYLRALPSYLTLPLFYVVIFLITTQYMRSTSLEKKLYGEARHSLVKQVLLSTLFGVVGGFIGTLLLLGVGVALSGSWLIYVWVAALGLAIVSPRLMCFAYGGGLVALLSLLFGWPDLDISSLLGLVALLHAVESVLMYISGHFGAVPVSIKNADGNIVGGFSLQRFWPVPLLALAVMPGVIPPDVGSIAMPGWWPLIVPGGLTAGFSFWMIPVVAGLGYGELAISTSPRARARESAGKLALYSLILFILAYLSTKHYFFIVLGTLFAPIGHELLVWTTNRREMGGTPLHQSLPGAIRILDVMPDSPAQAHGLRSGDIVYSCNGVPVASIHELRMELMRGGPASVVGTSRGTFSMTDRGDVQVLGIIPVPGDEIGMYLESKFSSPLDYLFRFLGR
jgi:hypothetical protein